MINLGDKVRDTITGFEGICTGRTVYLNGCISINVEGALKKDGERSSEWFDEQRIEFVERNAFRRQPSEAMAGGPTHSDPPRDGAQ